MKAEEAPTSSWRGEMPSRSPPAPVAAEPTTPQRSVGRPQHKRAIESIRLKHGLRQLLLTSPEHWLGYDAVGTGQGGMLISPGEVVDVPVPPLDDSQLLSYRIRCEDGLDIGFELLCLEGGNLVAAELPLEAWRRGDEFDGELRLQPAVRCVVRFDNSFSWFQTRTIHFAIEAQPVPTATAAQRRAHEQAEERSLREVHAGRVRAAEAEAVRRVHALRTELQRAEAELVALGTARATVEAAAAADAEAAAAERAAAATAAEGSGEDGGEGGGEGSGEGSG